MMTRNPDILFITEYIKNILYFCTVRQGKVLKSTTDIHYFCTDNELVYENYYSDFGPLNLACVYKFCKILNTKLKQFLNKQTIVYYTSIDPRKKANAAFLIGCYGVLYLGLSPKDALKPLLLHGQNYRPFQDATQGESVFTISLVDCLQAIKKAREIGFFNFQDFNVDEFERLDKIQGGDLNWIIPGKFLAFIGPVDTSISLYHPPEMYIVYFKENNVKIVIRLNKRMYDGNAFTREGILHYDLFFPDGSCPPRHILSKFMQISEEAQGALAVHCKAGLGRTGSLIGCYLIKHYRMTSHEAIGWMRICRPGSVIGHQQAWLEQLEPWLIKQGNLYRKRTYQDTEKLPIHEYGVYSIAERAIRPKPVIFAKSPSPPPPIQRQTRSEMASPIRPQASRIREAYNKDSDKESRDWSVRTSRLPTPTKSISKGETADKLPGSIMSRRSSGAGEPRLPPRSTSRSGAPRTPQPRNKDKLSDNSVKNTNAYGSKPTFRTTNESLIKSINDARNFLSRSSIFREERDKQMNPSIAVTPHCMISAQKYLDNTNVPRNMNNIPPSPFTSGTKTPTQLQQKRRLGRSPSPSPTRLSPRITEQYRVINTTALPERFTTKDSSKSTLREALSRLKLSMPRDGSVGAASLGARRDAPVVRRAPSVRSDERSIATQGDMLNSIKFQRRLRETLQTEKHNSIQKDNNLSCITSTPKDNKFTMKGTSTKMPTNLGSRLGYGNDFCGLNRDRATVMQTIPKFTSGYRPQYLPETGSLRNQNTSKLRPASPKPTSKHRSFPPPPF